MHFLDRLYMGEHPIPFGPSDATMRKYVVVLLETARTKGGFILIEDDGAETFHMTLVNGFKVSLGAIAELERFAGEVYRIAKLGFLKESNHANRL